MKKEWRIVAILLFTAAFIILWIPFSSGENQMTVELIGQITCFGENAFRVNAPEPGNLTITVRTKNYVYRTITADVEAGKNRIEWDGLGYNQEKLYPMRYFIDTDLKGISGNEYHYRFSTDVERCNQAMTLALTSSEFLYADHPEDWFLECKVIRSGTIVIQMIPEGSTDASYIFHTAVEHSRINHLTFPEIAGRTQIEPGRYVMKIHEISNPAYQKEVTLSVEPEKPNMPPVAVTGSIMPEEGDSDERIWELMMKPAVVVDIGYLQHQNVYTCPDENSDSLGTLHGQTQSLCVIELRDDWALIEAWNHEEGEKITGWVPVRKLKTEYPNTEYGLLVSKKDQTVTVYHHGKPIDTILVSTGKMEKGKLYQETAAGSFLAGEHRVDYSMNGSRYDFVIQYDGGNLIHQIPYNFGEYKKDFTIGLKLLGTKGSHACIRLQSEPGHSAGINAYWIWTHIPYHTRIIIKDDPEERQEVRDMLNGGNTGTPEIQKSNTIENPPETPEKQINGLNKSPDDQDNGTAPEESDYPSESVAAEKGNDIVVMTFGGDAVLGGREWYYFSDNSLMSYIEKYGMSYPFSGLQEYFATDDLTGINLECVLKADGSGEDLSKAWRFRGLPEYTGILTEGSVELVNIANNHTIDYGDAGYQATIQALEGIIPWCGRNHPTAVEIRGHLIGFGGCRETTYKLHPDVIAADIQALRDMGCEYIVYQCHWGEEYNMQFNATQQSMAHACVIAGANLVIGHHPHVVQGIDYIGGVPIVYSLGNLCFGGTIELDERGYDAILARVQISFDGETPETELKIIPIRTSSEASEGVNDFHPVPADDTDAARILKYIQNDSGVVLP